MGQAGPAPGEDPVPSSRGSLFAQGQRGAETHLQGLFHITVSGSGTSQEDPILLPRDRLAEPGSNCGSDEILVYSGT